MLGEGQLPEGWALAPVKDLVEIHYGKGLREDRRKSGPISVYGSNGVVGTHSVGLTDGPTVIIGRKGSIGEVHLCPSGCWPIDTTYYVDEFHGIDPKFLVSAFRKLSLSELDTSTAIPGLNRDDIYSQIIAVPPLAEQQRLVVQLENCFHAVYSLGDRLTKVRSILKRFRHATMAAACSGRLTQSWRDEKRRSLEDWRTSELSDICLSINDGDHQPPPKQATGVPFLTIGNISSGKLDFSETRFVPETYFKQIKPERKPRLGDVLYTVVGATIGIPVLVDIDQRFCFQRHIALLRPSPETTPEFLFIVMSSPGLFKEAWSRVTGTAQPTLPLGNLRTIPISIPPLTEQREIVRRVQLLLKLADTIQEGVNIARLKSQRLSQSILSKAFRGELVPTEAELARREGRHFEPASVLLERIRAERANQAKSPAASKRKLKKSSALVGA